MFVCVHVHLFARTGDGVTENIKLHDYPCHQNKRFSGKFCVLQMIWRKVNIYGGGLA